MKYIVFIGFLMLFGCSKTDLERNPFLTERGFDQSIDLALPAFDNLNYAGGSMYWPNGGIRGLLLYNLNGNGNIQRVVVGKLLLKMLVLMVGLLLPN